MKKLLAFLLSTSLVLAGCGSKKQEDSEVKTTNETTTYVEKKPIETKPEDLNFIGLNDPNLAKYIDQEVYENVLDILDSDEYYVSDIQTIYLSDSYLEELQFNSQKNVYFGYTLDELDKQFKGEKYVFTVGDNGETVVKTLDVIEPKEFYKDMATDVAIGAGVVLISATVASLTAEAAPAVSVILAAGAKTGTKVALSTGAISSAIGGAVEALEGGNTEDTLEAMAVSGCKGVKIGALTGTLTGAASSAFALRSATSSGLTLQQAAKIQQETKWSSKFISELHSVEEAEIYKTAGIQKMNIDGAEVYANPEILDYVDDLGRTNLERMQQGLNPIGKVATTIEGKTTVPSMEFHHVGQKSDGSLVLLERATHNPNGKVLNWRTDVSEIDRATFNKERKEILKKMAEAAKEGVLFN